MAERSSDPGSPTPACSLGNFGTILPLAYSQQMQADLGALPPDLAEILPGINQWATPGEGEPSQPPELPGPVPSSNTAALEDFVGFFEGCVIIAWVPAEPRCPHGLRPRHAARMAAQLGYSRNESVLG